jgi:DeoR family transcriptional regulator, aga operon transcriptional repressor
LVVVAVDGSTIGKIRSAKMVLPSRIHHLVTDSTANPEQLKQISATGVHVHVVEVAEV